MSPARKALMVGLALVAGACTSYGVVQNKPLSQSQDTAGYTLEEFAKVLNRRSDELSLALAFSGGGTRAAALSYGVMLELRDTRVVLDGRERRLLDAISVISSVSGGSFTSAYYGLYGDRLFVDFEERFLHRDVEGALLRSLFNPVNGSAATTTPSPPAAYYGRTLFGEATFAYLIEEGCADHPDQHLRSLAPACASPCPGILRPAGARPDHVPAGHARSPRRAPCQWGFDLVERSRTTQVPSKGLPRWLAVAKKRDTDNPNLGHGVGARQRRHEVSSESLRSSSMAA